MFAEVRGKFCLPAKATCEAGPPSNYTAQKGRIKKEGAKEERREGAQESVRAFLVRPYEDARRLWTQKPSKSRNHIIATEEHKFGQFNQFSTAFVCSRYVKVSVGFVDAFGLVARELPHKSGPLSGVLKLATLFVMHLQG